MLLRLPFIVSLFALCALWSPMTFASDATPLQLEGAKVLSAEELRAMIGKPGLRIFDLRKKASFVEGHIPNSASAAAAYDERQKKFDVSVLGSDRSAPVVFYSHGAEGWKSYWAAKAAIEAGFTQVMWFRGGFAEWEEKSQPIMR